MACVAQPVGDDPPVPALLHKWRHFAYAELKNPGAYPRILTTGEAPAGRIPGAEIGHCSTID
ncbi:MAG: hypothetical protein ACRDSR_17360 [Pseudonocardiaceae bacterium]